MGLKTDLLISDLFSDSMKFCAFLKTVSTQTSAEFQYSETRHQCLSPEIVTPLLKIIHRPRCYFVFVTRQRRNVAQLMTRGWLAKTANVTAQPRWTPLMFPSLVVMGTSLLSMSRDTHSGLRIILSDWVMICGKRR